MAAHPEGLRAHHRAAVLPRQPLQRCEARPELGARHVVGVAAELLALPGRVRGVRRGLAPAAERLAEPAVLNACLEQDRRERGPLEVRLPARARIAADVGDQADAGAPQQLDELVLVVVRVPDGEDLAHSQSTVSSWE
jgi:hypothetical protein